MSDSVWPHRWQPTRLSRPWDSPGKNTGVTTGKTIALTRQTFVDQVMSLLFNILSRLVIGFLPRNKHLLLSWLQSWSAVIFEPPQNKFCHSYHCFPMYLPWSDGTGCHDLHFWMLNFKPVFSLSSLTLSETGSLVPLHFMLWVVSFEYLRLLIFLLAILIPACASSSLASHMMYSAYKLNKQGDNIQLWHTPFSIWNQSVVPYLILTVTSLSAYRFL